MLISGYIKPIKNGLK